MWLETILTIGSTVRQQLTIGAIMISVIFFVFFAFSMNFEIVRHVKAGPHGTHYDPRYSTQFEKDNLKILIMLGFLFLIFASLVANIP